MTTKKSTGPSTPAKRAKPAARPKIRASHATVPEAKLSPKRRAARGDSVAARKLAPGAAKAGRAAGLRKVPLAGPKRTSKRVSAPELAPSGPSDQSREFAIALATAGIDKKALGIEILDVTGRVDYADFLVVMTGRSDRHVHAIAMGLEEAMRRKKIAPLSMEGLSAATWVLIDFGDVVVHVFQEEARLLYDIEGLWIDAGRVPVEDPGAASTGAPARPPEAR